MKGARPKLLAIRTGAMGDVCMLIPVLRALQQFISIDWLVNDHHAHVARCFPELDCRLILEPSAYARGETPFADPLVHQLQQEGYDYCLDFSHWPDVTRLVAKLQGIPIRAIAHDPAQDLLLNVNPLGIDLYQPFNRVVEIDPMLHQIEKWQVLVETACGVSLNLSRPMPKHPPPGKVLRIFVQVHASKKIKRWPARYFASVLRSLAWKRPVHCFVNSLPERYAKRLERLLIFSRCKVERVAFDPTLRGLRDCLQTVDFALGCDSGPMHFAGLLGIPTVVVYGPYPAREFRPVGRTFSVSPPGDNLPASAVPLRDVRTAMNKLVEELDSR